MTEQFPILKAWQRDAPERPKSFPWALLAPHEAQALANHEQTLERLAERGGLSPAELVAVMEDRDFRRMDEKKAIARVEELRGAEEDS